MRAEQWRFSGRVGGGLSRAIRKSNLCSLRWIERERVVSINAVHVSLNEGRAREREHVKGGGGVGCLGTVRL